MKRRTIKTSLQSSKEFAKCKQDWLAVDLKSRHMRWQITPKVKQNCFLIAARSISFTSKITTSSTTFHRTKQDKDWKLLRQCWSREQLKTMSMVRWSDMTQILDSREEILTLKPHKRPRKRHWKKEFRTGMAHLIIKRQKRAISGRDQAVILVSFRHINLLSKEVTRMGLCR